MIKKLNQAFAIKDKVEFIAAENHQVAIKIKTAWSWAVIYLQGAHLTSFERVNDGDFQELIWLSPLAHYQANKAIRGGIPICWPWFGKKLDAPDLAQHGFARSSLFDVKQVNEMSDGKIQLILELKNTKESEVIWPFQFKLEVIFTLGEELSIELKTTNTGDKDFSFSEAIHSYFKVDDIHQTELKGLAGAQYFDQLSQATQQQNGVLIFDQEIDQIYQTANQNNFQSLLIKQQNNQKNNINVSQKNANSTVVWNPWITKAQQMSDFPDDGFLEMLCVEAANTGDGIFLKKDQSHSLSQLVCAPQFYPSV